MYIRRLRKQGMTATDHRGPRPQNSPDLARITRVMQIRSCEAPWPRPDSDFLRLWKPLQHLERFPDLYEHRWLRCAIISHSEWCYAEVAAGEIFLALQQGLQAALWTLGGVEAQVAKVSVTFLNEATGSAQVGAVKGSDHSVQQHLVVPLKIVAGDRDVVVG